MSSPTSLGETIKNGILTTAFQMGVVWDIVRADHYASIVQEGTADFDKLSHACGRLIKIYEQTQSDDARYFARCALTDAVTIREHGTHELIVASLFGDETPIVEQAMTQVMHNAPYMFIRGLALIDLDVKPELRAKVEEALIHFKEGGLNVQPDFRELMYIPIEDELKKTANTVLYQQNFESYDPDLGRIQVGTGIPRSPHQDRILAL